MQLEVWRPTLARYMSDGLTEKFFNFYLINLQHISWLNSKNSKKVLTNGLCSQKRVTYWVKKLDFFSKVEKSTSLEKVV
jgi:hypothetical protein